MPPALSLSRFGKIRAQVARGILLALGALVLPAVAAPLAPAAAPPVTLTEYSAKAALLFNVAKYAEWPATAFPAADAPIVIGIFGDDPFGDMLDRIVRGRVVNGRPLVIRRAGGIADLKGAHLVFVSAAESHAAQDCAVLEEFNTLTVGDTGQTAVFTALNFAVEGNKIVFTVDLSRASRAGVTLSSKLLNLAKAVKRPTPIETR